MPREKSALLRRLGAPHPIFQAPMGGGYTTPALVAAICEAGGFGALGGAYLTPQAIADQIAEVRALTSRPFQVNLFAGGWTQTSSADAGPMLALLAELHPRLGLSPPVLPHLGPDPFPDQFEVVLAARPAAFSFTFGIPSPAQLGRARAAGIALFGTATTVHEARLLAAAGVDAVMAQGAEAGAHRGTFASPFETALVPTMRLVAEIAEALPDLPILAAGGLMTGEDVAAAIERGAEAGVLGTAFMACPEAGTAEAHKQALLAAEADTTVITRAFSGRPARGLFNEFIDRVGEAHVLPYPLQNALTRPMRTAAGKLGEAGLLSLWAGKGVTRIRALPAGELTRLLIEELQAASPALV